MPIRLTVGGLMLVVAFLAVVLAAGRVHVSLGSLAFGVLSIAWARTARWVERRRAGGGHVGRFAVACDFVASLGFAAAMLAIAFLPAVCFLFALLTLRSFGPNHYRPDVPTLVVVVVVGSLPGARVLRLIKKP